MHIYIIIYISEKCSHHETSTSRAIPIFQLPAAHSLHDAARRGSRPVAVLPEQLGQCWKSMGLKRLPSGKLTVCSGKPPSLSKSTN